MYDLQHEQPPVSFVLFVFGIAGELFFLEFVGALLMVPLFIGQIVKQLPDARVLRPRRRLLVEPARFEFNCCLLYTSDAADE